MVRRVVIEPTWRDFRRAARRLLAEECPPTEVVWSEAGATEQLSLLTGAAPSDPGPETPPARVPRRFVEIGEVAAAHRDPAPWSTLYRVLVRVAHGERHLLDDPADPDVARLEAMQRAVFRDEHKMHAFVRFRTVRQPDGAERYVAWFEPRHRIVRRAAPFFERRFPSMAWSILTPDECAHWDGESLRFSPGVPRTEAPAHDDALEPLWLAYYASTFNPARVRVEAMRSEMPVRYWRHMPETSLIPDLLRGAPGRVRSMIDAAQAGGPGAGRSDPRRASPPAPAGRRPTVSPRVRVAPDRSPPPSLRPPATPPRIHVGVAGWDYPDWAGRVYPTERSGVDRLRWVAARFDLIEVNSTFYRPASPRATRSWMERTADRNGLRLTVKLHRAFTHERGPWRDADVRAVRAGLDPLLAAGRLHGVLVQFPWSYKNRPAERARLRRIARAFSHLPLRVEVRHASWDDAGFRAWLDDRGIGLASIDQPMFPNTLPPFSGAVGGSAYLRLHGRNADAWFRPDATRDERYDYRYSDAELVPWAERAHALAAREDVGAVDVVFNNHYRAQAVDNALAFARLLAAAWPSSRAVTGGS